MKKLELISLHLVNFKGASDRFIEFNDGKSTDIYAANRVGKSTLFTAYLWLLTGKDEFDRQDHELKNTKDKKKNRSAHEVTGVFRIDGQTITLKRAYLEKWVRPKGELNDEFKGHETKYFYNDISISAREYAEKVESIMPSNMLKILSNPSYFLTLKNVDQRRGLIGLAGTIARDEVIDKIATAKDDFSTLIMVLNGGTTVDKYIENLKKKINVAKSEQEQYPHRIDEVRRSLPEQFPNWKELEQQIEAKDKEHQEIISKMVDAGKARNSRQTEIIQLQDDLTNKKLKLQEVKERVSGAIPQDNKATTESTIKSKELQLVEDEKVLNQLTNAAKKSNERLIEINTHLDEFNSQIGVLREAWNNANNRKFEFNAATCTCPTCKQLLPATDIDSMRKELESNFNQAVIAEKNKAVKESDAIKVQISKLTAEKQALKLNFDTEIEDQEAKIANLKTEIQNLKATISNVVPFETRLVEALNNDSEYKDLQYDIKSLETLVESKKNALDEDQDNDLKIKKESTGKELNELRDKYALKTTYENTESRLKTLLDEESANGQEIANLERSLWEAEKFVRAEMSMVEERVNEKFNLVKFRLWSEQVNGQIVEDCVCELDGVPYSTLNTAGKLQAGLDVLNTFSKHYQMAMPVFCDNRESVTEIPKTGLQIISLFVSPADTKMRIEPAA